MKYKVDITYTQKRVSDINPRATYIVLEHMHLELDDLRFLPAKFALEAPCEYFPPSFDDVVEMHAIVANGLLDVDV